MSQNGNGDDGGTAVDNPKGYTNPETDQALNEALREIGSGTPVTEGDDAIPELSPEQEDKARRTVAREDQIDDDFDDPRPDLRERATVDFRGYPFEFTELGDSELEAADFADIDEDDIQAGSEAGEYVYRTLGKHGVNTDEDYWRQYSLQGTGDKEGLMDLFTRVIMAFNEDVDPEEVEAAGNLPSQNAGSRPTE